MEAVQPANHAVFVMLRNEHTRPSLVITFLRSFFGVSGSPPDFWLTGGARAQPHSLVSAFQSLHCPDVHVQRKLAEATDVSICGKFSDNSGHY